MPRRDFALSRRTLAVGAVACLAVVWASVAAGTITPLGRYSFGACYHGCARGDTVYWNSGPTLRIADFSDPAQPRDIGQVAIEHTILEIYAVPGRAYLSCVDVGLVVVDTSDPTAPRVVGSLRRFRPVWGMAMLGGYLLMGNASDGMDVLDVSDPAHIRSVGHWYTPGGSAHDMVVEGSLVYLSAGRSGLQILDFSHPTAPTLVAQIDGFVPGFGIAKAGDFVCLEELPTGLLVIDVSDPAAPALRGTYTGFQGTGSLTAHDGYVFAAYAQGVHTIDVRNPDQPTLAGSFYQAQAMCVFACPSRLYLAALWDGLRVLDDANPAAVVETGAVDDNGYALGVAAGGGFVYQISWYDGLRIIDAHDPASPRLAAQVPFYAGYTPILRDGILYVAATDAGALVLDVHDAAHPVALAAMPGWWVRGLALDGDTIYVADDSYGLTIYDVSDPATPRRLGSLIMSGEVTDVAVRDGWAYVASGNQGLRVVDVRNPALPVLHGAYATAGYCLRVVAEGQVLAVSESTAGVEILDTSVPSTPVRRSSIEGIQCRDAVPRGGRLYVTDEQSGLLVYDITNPSSPLYRDGVGDLRGAERVAIEGRQIWMTVMEDGVWGLRDDALTPVLLAGFRAQRAAGGVRLDWTLKGADRIAGLQVYRQAGGAQRDLLTPSPLAPAATGECADPSPPPEPATYWLRGLLADGGAAWLGSAAVGEAAPARLALWPAGPNPFNPRVSLRFALPRPGHAVLAIFDQRGRHVRTVLDAELPAGDHTATWDGSTDGGAAAASGAYVALLRTDLGTRSVKLTLAR